MELEEEYLQEQLQRRVVDTSDTSDKIDKDEIVTRYRSYSLCGQPKEPIVTRLSVSQPEPGGVPLPSLITRRWSSSASHGKRCEGERSSSITSQSNTSTGRRRPTGNKTDGKPPHLAAPRSVWK